MTRTTATVPALRAPRVLYSQFWLQYNVLQYCQSVLTAQVLRVYPQDQDPGREVQNGHVERAYMRRGREGQATKKKKKKT